MQRNENVKGVNGVDIIVSDNKETGNTPKD